MRPPDAADEIIRYTYCDMCNHGPKCGIKAYIRDGIVTRIESLPDYPNTPLCAKAYALLQEQYHPDRLLHPVKRTAPKGSPDPGWVRISWDEAYDTISQKLNQIKAREGAEKVLFMTGDPKEMRGPLQRLALTFGSPNYGTESSTCYRAPALAALLTYGQETLGSPPSSDTRLCLLWSTNPAWSRSYLMGRLRKAKDRGVKFIVVDPRLTPTAAQLADVHLQLRPGTDAALALGLMHVIIDREWYDTPFVRDWTHGFDALRERVSPFTPERVEAITRVPAAKIIEAARLLAFEKPGTWLCSACATVHSTNGTQNQRSILSLVALTGNVEVPGGVTFPTHPLHFDIFDTSLAFTRAQELLPALAHKRLDAPYYPVWAEYFDEIQLNPLPEYVRDGQVRAAVMFGVNAMMWPQSHLYQQALSQLEFGVAVDYFIRPQTHNFVDMVLPAATSFERMAPLAIFGRRIFLREPIVAPRGEARTDWDIIFQLGVKLGYPDEFWHGNVEAGLNFLLEPVDLTVNDLRQSPDHMLEVPPPGPELARKFELGGLRRDGQPGFETSTGKVELYSEVLKRHGLDPLPNYCEPGESPVSTPDLADRYPLILNTGARLPVYTHSKLREISWIREVMPHPFVRINPQDATARGISSGDDVVLESAHGQIILKAEVTRQVMPGVIDASHGWAQANVNELVPRQFDPISGFPPYREGLCQVRKVPCK